MKLCDLDLSNSQYSNIPDNTIEDMTRLLKYNVPVGGFLTAVLDNDLRGALCRADLHNRAELRNIVSLVIEYFPSTFGSKGSTDRFLEEGIRYNVTHDGMLFRIDSKG